jgi:carboxypeptidase PM20D1
MLKRILQGISILLLILIAIVLINTFRTKPWPTRPSMALKPMPDSAILHFSRAVQIPTVSFHENLPVDTSAFTAFGNFINTTYPLLSSRLGKTAINRFNYVYEWKGRNESLQPIVLMAHYDVVPVEREALKLWTVAPFSGAITDTCIWGRGSVDDKCGVVSILEATETMLKKGFIPERTIYLCFGHDEEISGRSAGLVAQYLNQKNVRAEMVLDEGGEIAIEKIKELGRPVAAIGVGEKGYASFELSVEKEGGHSMMPANESAIDILNEGLYQLKRSPSPFKITEPVKEFLKRVGTSSHNFFHKMAACNMWLFEEPIKKIVAAQPEGSAMLHTTIATTLLASGDKDNMIPFIAKAIVNARILPGENAQLVEQFIRNAVNDDRIKIKKVSQYGSDPSSVTSTSSPAFKRVENAVYETIPGVLPAHYLNIGATDSRYFRLISDGVVNFLPMTDSKGFHGVDERLPIRDLQRCISFFETIIEESSKELK